MTAKHPERRPVEQVEGAVRIADIEGKRVYLKAASHQALVPLAQVLVKTAERTLRQRAQHVSEEQGAA